MIHPEPTERLDWADVPAGAADDDGDDVLTSRLAQLRDPAWMKSVLESALDEMARTPVSVDDYRIEYCKIKPNRDINAALQLVMRPRGGGTPDSRRVSCTVFPSTRKGYRKFCQESQNGVEDSIARRCGTDGFERLMAFVPDPAMIVRVFPMDPVLTGLVPATDVTYMTDLLGRHLRERWPGAGQPRGLTYKVLHYKPGRSCALHYDLATEQGADGEPQAFEFYGKVYRDDRGDHCYELLRAAWEASCASGVRWHAARPVVHLPEWRLVLQEAVAGRQFRHLLGDLAHDNAGDAELCQVEQHLKMIAAAIRSLQTSAMRLGPACDFARLMAGQEKNLAYLGRWHPDLAAEIAEIRRELVRLERETAPGPLMCAHCDFAHGNVLIGDDGVGIIDFDRAGLAEPAYDVAYFLTHLWSFGIRHPSRQAHIARLCEFFRNAYLDLAPDVSPARLALYEVLDFAAYVLRNFRKQSHQANWFEWAKAQVQAAWQRLEQSARQRGSVA